MEEMYVTEVIEDELDNYYYLASGLQQGPIYLANGLGRRLSKSDLNPGWSPKLAIIGPTSGILILQKDRDTALWFLNDNNSYVSNNLDEIMLSPDNLIFIIIDSIIDSVLLKRPIPPAATCIKAYLSEAVIARYSEWKQSKLIVVDVSHDIAEEVASTFNLADDLELSEKANKARLAKSLHTILGDNKIFFEALVSGKITICCPYSDAKIKSSHCIYVNNYLLAYHFATLKGPLILVGYGSSVLLPMAAYFPLENTFAVTTRSAARAALFRDFFPQFFSAVLNSADLLIRYLQSDNCKAAPIVFIDHIGHHLWNELTGLAHATDYYDFKSVRSLYVLWPDKGEHFGGMEDIFDLACDVYRVRDGSFPQCLYERNELGIRLSGWFVDKHLQDKLIRHAFRAEDEFAANTKLLIQQSDISFLISFRFENRSWLNQKQEVIALISDLLADGKKLFIAIDGHNSNRSGGIYRSHDETILSTYLQAELSVATEIEERFKDKIHFVNNIGGSVERSIILAKLTHFFITPWGAALAKYKWAAGARGFIASNSFALTVSGARRIYEDSRFMETPCPDIWFPVSQIVDRAAPQGTYSSAVERLDRANFETIPKSLSNLVMTEFFTREWNQIS